MRALKSVALGVISIFLFVSGALAQQSQNVEMRITVLWADHHAFGDQQDGNVTGIPGTNNPKSAASGEPVSGNSVSNMDIRVMLINEDGSTIAESSPDSEGTVKFTVVGSVTNPSNGSRIFPVYRLRVRGATIEEQFIDNLQPGLADRMVSVELHKKGEKKGSGGGIISANSLKIPHKAEKEFQRGQKAFLKNKLSAARDYFQKAVTIYPQYDVALNALGVVLMKLGDPVTGQKAFEQAVAANDKFAPAYVNLARIMAREKKYDDAALLLTRSLSLEPLNPEALSMLCQFDAIREKFDDVPALAQKLHSIPHDGQALCHFAAGNALEHLNRPTEAIYEYMLFMKEDPTSNLSAEAREAVDRIRQQQNQAKAQ